jgi:hypothetical protein
VEQNLPAQGEGVAARHGPLSPKRLLVQSKGESGKPGRWSAPRGLPHVDVEAGRLLGRVASRSIRDSQSYLLVLQCARTLAGGSPGRGSISTEIKTCADRESWCGR